ncbi:hypothetical protein KDW_38230 [Dictyobacter vulcani]|uniref:Uncharacterized protein n=1 Tax=Dictyobacter vulcani TaxID=2607529 RepID=A0A5J4KT83_9CHLR|nr:hypothetical protein [Dictyobacter vulcani]GER89661.1 hypothetical protein KDW_38230 [Dictyobacter vulcani]
MVVACTKPVDFQTPEGRDWVEAALIETRIPNQWYRPSMYEGTKGPRLFDWVVVTLFFLSLQL